MIVADTHLHLYPCYDTGPALAGLIRNLKNLHTGGVLAAFLADRADGDAYARLAAGPATPLDGGISLEPSAENGALVVRQGSDTLHLFAGRQIVTAERLEILGLVMTDRVPDGLSALQTVKAVLDKGGVPVLSWAPGKWFFKRGQVVDALLGALQPGQCLVGDTSLRPTLWKIPRRMRRAMKEGFPVVAGSDPLPFRGEERHMGTYASVLDVPLDTAHPVTGMRKILLSSSLWARHAGTRSGPLDVLVRLVRHKIHGPLST